MAAAHVLARRTNTQVPAQSPVVVPRARRLPVVPKPVSGEAFASWVDRVAGTLSVPPGRAAHALGLECSEGAAITRPVFFGVILTSQSLSGLRDATGLPVRTLQAMQLARYDGTALDFAGLEPSDRTSMRLVALREWMLTTSSRACPYCLAERPVWPLWWRLGIAAVCPVHRCLLIDLCPTCGIRLRRGNHSNQRGLLSRSPLPGPGECGNRPPGGPSARGGRRGGLCPQQYKDMPTVAVNGSLAVLQLQVLAIADGAEGSVAGTSVSSSDWFASLRLLTAMARLASDETDVSVFPGYMAQAVAEDRRRRQAIRSGSASHLGAMPATAAHAMAYLALASAVLDAPNSESGAQVLAPWARRLADLQRAAGVGDRLRKMRRPAVIDEMMAAVAPRSSRVVGALAAVRPVGISPCHVPHLADAADYSELIAAHLPGTSPLWGRRFTTLALARLAGASSWPLAAEVLGMDGGKAIRAATKVVRRISDADAFWERVTLVAERLQERGLVDYAARRAGLADLCELPDGALAPVFRPLGMSVTPQRRRHAAAWIWQRFTSGDPHEAPAYRQEWGNATAESIRVGWWRFQTRLPVPAAAALDAWGTAHLSGKGIS